MKKLERKRYWIVYLGVLYLFGSMMFQVKAIEQENLTLEDRVLSNDYYKRNLSLLANFGNPQLGDDSLWVSPSIAYEGDNVQIGLRLDDSDDYDEYNVSTSVYVHYKAPLSGDTEFISLSNFWSNRYEGTFNVTKSTEAGYYEVDYIEVYRYSLGDYYPGYYESESFYF